MADMNRYKPWALLIGTTSVGFRNLRVMSENLKEVLRSDGATYPDLVEQLQKRPVFRAEIFDPSLVTEFQAVQSGETFESITIIWRAITQEGGPGGDYLSFTIALGALMPVALNSPFESIATLEIECRVRYDTGVAYAIGTTSGAQAIVSKFYRAKELVLGSDTIDLIRSVNATWTHRIVQEEMIEPDHYGYDQLDFEGTADLPDLSLVNLARLEDGSTEVVTVTLEDLETPANTIAYSFGTCDVMAVASGDSAQVSWQKLQQV